MHKYSSGAEIANVSKVHSKPKSQKRAHTWLYVSPDLSKNPWCYTSEALTNNMGVSGYIKHVFRKTLIHRTQGKPWP